MTGYAWTGHQHRPGERKTQMFRPLGYVERFMWDRQRELLAEAEKRSAVRLAHVGHPLGSDRSAVRERTLLTTAARPGAALVFQPRSPSELVSECAEKVAAWRLAAARFGRSLISVGRRLEQVGKAA